MKTEPIYDLVRRLLADESGDTLAEYALVMAVLTISMMVAYDAIAASGNSSVAYNENGMAQMAAKSQ